MVLKSDAKLEKKTICCFKKKQKFGEFWSKHSKISKICTLIDPFWAKYIKSDLQNYRGFMFHDIEESWKIWRKTNLWFGKWHEQFDEFSSEHLKGSKTENLQRSYVQCQWRMIKNL